MYDRLDVYSYFAGRRECDWRAGWGRQILFLASTALLYSGMSHLDADKFASHSFFRRVVENLDA